MASHSKVTDPAAELPWPRRCTRGLCARGCRTNEGSKDTESQNPRMAEVQRNLWRPSDPTPAQAGCPGPHQGGFRKSPQLLRSRFKAAVTRGTSASPWSCPSSHLQGLAALQPGGTKSRKRLCPCCTARALLEPAWRTEMPGDVGTWCCGSKVMFRPCIGQPAPLSPLHTKMHTETIKSLSQIIL